MEKKMKKIILLLVLVVVLIIGYTVLAPTESASIIENPKSDPTIDSQPLQEKAIKIPTH